VIYALLITVLTLGFYMCVPLFALASPPDGVRVIQHCTNEVDAVQDKDGKWSVVKTGKVNCTSTPNDWRE